MARTRSIKPAFFANEHLAELSAGTRLLFIGLWTIADKNGKLEDRPKRIKAELFPYDNIELEDGLSKLHNAGFIDRYSVNGVNVILINNFVKHQNPHNKEQPSTLPDKTKPAENCHAVERLVQVQGKDGTSTNLGAGESSLLPITYYPLPITGNLSPITDNPITGNASHEKKGQDENLPSWQRRPETPQDGYKFEGTVIKLNDNHFFDWLEIYGGTYEQFWNFLTERDDWLAKQPPEKRKKWFVSTFNLIKPEVNHA